MSAKIMGQIWDLVLPPAKLIVLMAYADHADHLGNNVFPSRALIAWKTGYSVRQVQRITDQLVKDGLLQVKENAPGKLIKYSVNLSCGKRKPEFTSKGRQNVTPDKMSPLTNGQGEVGHSYVTSTPDMPVPEMRTNHQDNRHIEPSITTGAVIDAWVTAQDAVIPNAFKLKSNHEYARGMIEKGITVQDVCDYLAAMAIDSYWGGKFIELPKMAKEIAKWKEQRAKRAPAAGTNGKKYNAQQQILIAEQAAKHNLSVEDYLAHVEAMQK